MPEVPPRTRLDRSFVSSRMIRAARRADEFAEIGPVETKR